MKMRNVVGSSQTPCTASGVCYINNGLPRRYWHVLGRVCSAGCQASFACGRCGGPNGFVGPAAMFGAEAGKRPIFRFATFLAELAAGVILILCLRLQQP